MKILIVDDDPLSLKMLEHALVGERFEIEKAASGAEALKKLREGSCRLVISDWEMPGMTGEELCKAVRREDFDGYIYIILLTHLDGKDYLIRGLSAGADEFLSKPFDPTELAVRVRTGERILAMETRDVAIFSMAKLAESRDPETGEHLERIRNYSRLLAQHLMDAGRSDDEPCSEYVRLIYQTSPLHDIGKVGIPDCVLLKPGRLNDREFEIMKTHAALGAETLAAALRKYPSAIYLLMARDIALSHHEWFDGTGYPGHLAGEQIPMCGRIVALADVYDALTSKRVYKEAFSHDIARAILLKESGSHFDPEIVQAFTDVESKFIAIQERLKDGKASLPDEVAAMSRL
ncbi:MAG: response regulator [Planctomycetota bacterium]|nr:response regulator [Planctomycetota bacterium]